MTPPRFVLPGQMRFVTARAVARCFRFVPRREVTRTIAYVFAVMVKKYGMEVHECCFMSNHFHLLFTDVEGVAPDFMRDLNSLLARSLNALRGHRGTAIEKGYNLLEVADDGKVLDYAVYTLANPCAAHLVRRAKQWKGFNSRSLRYGEAVTFPRPKTGLWGPRRLARRRVGNSRRIAYAGRSKLPDEVSFTLIRPQVLPQLSDDELRAHVLERLDQRELELIEDRRRQGREVLGMRCVLAQQPWQCPQSYEPLFTTTPKVASRSRWARVEALGRNSRFEARYYLVNAAYRCGETKIVWPRGTWLMRRRFGVPCETSPP